jgi:hypothetical protein
MKQKEEKLSQRTLFTHKRITQQKERLMPMQGRMMCIRKRPEYNIKYQ